MGQKSRWTLPETVHPDGYRKFVVCVPNERFYIAAFQGLLIELTYSKNWQRDNALTAAAVSRVWQDVLANVTCDEECAAVIDNMEYEMSICEQLRFHNGKLQGYCCGVWVDITGQPGQGVLGPDQPGGGTEQPAAGGGCATYQGKLRANETWLLPTVVNTGDTISFANIQGAGSDGTVHWYCNDGQIFFAGACVGSKSFDGTDPAPALYHMALVLKIGATYYDISAGPITVGAAVTNQTATLQVNDASLAGNSGEYSFEVAVCNNSSGRWSETINLALTAAPFRAIFSTVDRATWVAGAGWHSITDGVSNQARILIPVLPSAQYDTVSLKYNSIGNPPTQLFAGSGTDAVAGNQFPTLTPLATGTGKIGSQTVTPYTATSLRLDIFRGDTTADFDLTEVTIGGPGPSPF